jgi:hypothetical protein
MNEPFRPPEYDEPRWRNIKAAIDAHPEAFKWIVNELCGTYDLSYRPDSERNTTFAEGKRFVGLQIVKMANLDVRVFSPPPTPTRKNERRR